MKTGKNIPDDLKKFVKENFHSVELIEVLLILYKSSNREYTATEIGDELRTSYLSVENRLETLLALKLIKLKSDHPSGLRSKFCPDTYELQILVEQLAQYYTRMPYTMIDLIYRTNDAE